METILSGFHSSVGIWPYHPITPEMEARAEELLDLLEIRHLKDRLLTEMSSGEVRRAVIGRALAHRPKALILDEPCNSLDIAAMRELREVMRTLATSGVTRPEGKSSLQYRPVDPPPEDGQPRVAADMTRPDRVD